jgi:hypothetical protein
VDVIGPGDLCSRAATHNDRKLLKDVCAQRRTEDLAEVLKYPFRTGEEEIMFNQLNSETQRDFVGGVWKFVEQADSLGIKDVDSPAKRPSMQDALEELARLQVRRLTSLS